MCSFSRSPLPTPSRKRPGIIAAAVAAAWATIAGWVRMVGQVTAVVRRSRVVAAIPPITVQHEGAIALRTGPGVEVVADPGRAETGLLHLPRVIHELSRAVLLAREKDSVYARGSPQPDERVSHDAFPEQGFRGVSAPKSLFRNPGAPGITTVPQWRFCVLDVRRIWRTSSTETNNRAALVSGGLGCGGGLAHGPGPLVLKVFRADWLASWPRS